MAGRRGFTTCCKKQHYTVPLSENSHTDRTTRKHLSKPTPRSEIAKLSRNVFRAFNGADVFRKAWMVRIYIHDKNVKANKLVESCTNKRHKKKLQIIDKNNSSNV